MKSIDNIKNFDFFITILTILHVITENTEAVTKHIVDVIKHVSLEKKNATAIDFINLGLKIIVSVHKSLQD